jgi:hypothetical protein
MGAHAGDLLLFFQSQQTGGDFYQSRSTDNGHSWGAAQLILNSGGTWNHASCNVIQLNDGRLLMTYQRRLREGTFAKNRFIYVRWSSDGGDTWSAGTKAFTGDNWECRPIQVPNDMNGDGHDDIYVFFTQQCIPTTIDEALADRTYTRGRAVAWFASYDNGVTWTDPNPERWTARIVHRNYLEDSTTPETQNSGGGMPTPFILPNNRCAFVSEEIDYQGSPRLVATDSNDWNWSGSAFTGAWTSVDYDGYGDESVYPASDSNMWIVAGDEFGGAPYGVVLPNGNVAVSFNRKHLIRVWVGDANGERFQEQEAPFGLGDGNHAMYSFIEPISDTEVLVGAHSDEDPAGAFIHLRRGTISSTAPPHLDCAPAATGTNLSLAWPAIYRGWILEYKTNLLSTGWTEVVGSQTNTDLTVPISPASPAKFYRLRSP